MGKALSVLFGAGFTVATAWALGRLLLQRLKLGLHREEENPIAFVAGSAVLSLCLFAMAAGHLLYDASFLVLGIGALLGAWRTGALSAEGPSLPSLPRRWLILFLCVYAPFAVVALVHAAAPEVSPDGSTYHLGVMARFYRAHGLVAIPEHMYAHLSQGVDLLFLMAFAFGRHSAAALVHCAFLLALPWLILRFGQRAGYPGAGAAAALFVFVAPVVAVDGASAYNDVAVGTVIFAVFYLAEMARDGVKPGMAILLGLLAGFAYGVKYTAFLAVPFAFAALWFALRRQRSAVFRPLALFLLCAGLMIAPWVARNAVQYGNPFSPLLNAWFPNPHIHVSFERQYGQYMRKYIGLESYADIPAELTVRGLVLGGIAGPLFLLAPLALLALRLPLGRRVLLAAVWFALPYPLNIGTRFLIPALPFLSLALALAVPAGAARLVLPSLVVLHALASWPWLQATYCNPYAWRIAHFPWRAALRIEKAEDWLAREWTPYRIPRMVEMATAPDAVVLAFSPIMEAYTSREIRVGFQSAQGERMVDAIQVALLRGYQPAEERVFSFDARELRSLRVVQTAQEDGLLWSVAELRVFDGGRELERVPGWRLRSKPFPWDVQLAFDNSPLTRWRSWEWIRPGMFIEVDFDGVQRVSRVSLEMSDDQHGVELQLEGVGTDGARRLLAGKAVKRGIPYPLGLRRAAVEELKRGGITHVLVSEGDLAWEDFRDKAELWGIREAGAVDNTRLYTLE